MSDTIFKYEFDIADHVEISMPRGAEVLAVQLQHGVPCVWARVDPSEEGEIRRFRIFGTGHDLPGLTWNGRYVSTFQTHGGALVWHLYEEHE